MKAELVFRRSRITQFAIELLQVRSARVHELLWTDLHEEETGSIVIQKGCSAQWDKTVYFVVSQGTHCFKIDVLDKLLVSDEGSRFVNVSTRKTCQMLSMENAHLNGSSGTLFELGVLR